MSLRRKIENLGSYPSLLLLGLPSAVVEPLKLAAVALAGKGHWITGTAMIAACYAFSLLFVERLFAIVKPKLLTISWFATVWKAFVSVRRLVSDILGGHRRQIAGVSVHRAKQGHARGLVDGDRIEVTHRENP